MGIFKLFFAIGTLLVFHCDFAQALTCAQVFAVEPAPRQVLKEDLEAAQRFQWAQQVWLNALSSEKSESVKEATHLFVQSANRLLDHIVDNILIVKFEEMPEERGRVFQSSTSMMFELLLGAMQIPQEALEQAIHVRYLDDMEQRQKKEHEFLEKADVLGFLYMDASHRAEDETVETVSLGFLSDREIDSLDEGAWQEQNWPETGVAPSIDARVSFHESGEPDFTQPIGFLPARPDDPDSESQSANPVGFVHFKNQPLENLKVHLDLERGLFSATTTNPIGFLP